MTDKEFNFQKKRIKKLIDKWVRPIGLGWWRVDFEYHRERQSNKNSTYAPVMNEDGAWVVVFEVRTDHNYAEATIDCYLPTIAEVASDERLEEYFVHELMHIFLSPMSTKAKADAEELVATRLAKAMLWTLEFVKKDKPTSRRPRKMPQKRLQKKKADK